MRDLMAAVFAAALCITPSWGAEPDSKGVRPPRDFPRGTLECTAAGVQVLLIEDTRTVHVEFLEGDLPELSFIAGNGARYQYLLLSPAMACRIDGTYRVIGGALNNQSGIRTYDLPQTVTCLVNGRMILQEHAAAGLSVKWTMAGFTLNYRSPTRPFVGEQYGLGEACLIERRDHELLPVDPNLP